MIKKIVLFNKLENNTKKKNSKKHYNNNILKINIKINLNLKYGR